MKRATITDELGNELAIANIRPGAETESLAISRIFRGKGDLLDYYFGKGKRYACVETGDVQVRGRLSTRWAGHQRLWQITVISDIPVASIVAPQ